MVQQCYYWTVLLQSCNFVLNTIQLYRKSSWREQDNDRQGSEMKEASLDWTNFCHKKKVQSEEKKVLEQLKKDLDSLVKKGKLAENTLKQAQRELEDFQVIYI